MRKSGFVTTALGLALLASSPAGASLITDHVTFSAVFTNLGVDYGGGVSPTFTTGGTPASPVTGSFDIKFDPTLTYSDDTADISNPVFNGITSDSAFAFDYYPVGSTHPAGFLPDELVVGGLADGAHAILLTNPVPNDFYLHVLDFTTSPAFQQLGYTETSQNVYFYTLDTSNDSVTVSPASSVPEPASWSIVLAGLFGAGFFRRRRRSA